MMTGSWLLARFAIACAGSLVLAFALSMLLRLAARRWPALLAHRSVWLGGQAAVVLVFLLAVAPLPRSAIAPALTLPAPAPQHALMTEPDVLPPLTQATLALPPAPDTTDTVWHYLPGAWLAASMFTGSKLVDEHELERLDSLLQDWPEDEA